MSTLPPTPPLERLQVTDGLLLTAERWRVAHAYHRQRQNLHFQGSYQPGIVAGLGVCPVAAPPEVAAQYRDGRWLQVQPGLAIDREGNPIVVPRPITYRIAAEPGLEPLQVYLVLSFVDPDRLERQDGTYVVQETFRLEEKVSPPDAMELELCRISLMPGDVVVRSPQNPFSPTPNDLDLRHRPWIQPRPKGELRLGYLTPSSQAHPAVATALGGLVASLAGLYPALQGHPDITHLPLRDGPPLPLLPEYDLLHLAYGDAKQLQTAEVEWLKAYLALGGVLLVDIPAAGSELDELLKVWADVIKALVKMAAVADGGAVYEDLRAEHTELENCMGLEIETLIPPLSPLLAQEVAANASASGGYVHPSHPLRSHPFAFGMFPLLRGAPLALFNWGGIVVTVGGLPSAWGGADTLLLPRETIRSAQELGVNLLHFAWQRRQWTQCLTPIALPAPAPTPSRPARLNAIYDKLDR